MKRFALPLIVACFTLIDCRADENMTSPDGKVAASVFLTQSGDLRYRVQFKNQEVVEPSVLGITAKRKQWTTAVPFKVDRSSVDRSQKMKVSLAKGGGLVVQLIKQSN